MFGYRLRLVKKKELQDISIFENVVNEIDRNCDNLGQLLTSGTEMSDKDFIDAKSIIKRLRSLFDIYTNNKYSMPSNITTVAQALDTLSKKIFHFHDAMRNQNQLEEMYVSAAKAKLFERFSHEELSEMSSEEIYNKTHEIVEEFIMYQLNEALTALYNLQSTIAYDVVRVTMGVDIYADYKGHIKVPNSPTDMVIRYKLQTEGFNILAEKEKLKK